MGDGAHSYMRGCALQTVYAECEAGGAWIRGGAYDGRRAGVRSSGV